MPYEFDAEERQKSAPKTDLPVAAERPHQRPQRQRRPSQLGKMADVPEPPKAQFIADSVDPDVCSGPGKRAPAQ